ncbi:MAG TPA: NAD(P)-binding protein, partial [Holophaga sp.]|nr:NAD(P)-binding protein [Holophaga sp.]
MKREEAAAFKIPLFFSKSKESTDVNLTGSWSFLQPAYHDRTAPCSQACPCGTDIPRVETYANQGRYGAAWRTILMENPLPGVCGRVCFHPCEKACNRGELDAPVSINFLERFITDEAFRDGAASGITRGASKGKRVAVVGSGPAGLSAAYFLARLGYDCEVFESAPEPGGLLRWGIPAYRLPGRIL